MVGPLKPVYLRYEILGAGLEASRRQGPGPDSGPDPGPDPGPGLAQIHDYISVYLSISQYFSRISLLRPYQPNYTKLYINKPQSGRLGPRVGGTRYSTLPAPTQPAPPRVHPAVMAVYASDTGHDTGSKTSRGALIRPTTHLRDQLVAV